MNLFYFKMHMFISAHHLISLDIFKFIFLSCIVHVASFRPNSIHLKYFLLLQLPFKVDDLYVTNSTTSDDLFQSDSRKLQLHFPILKQVRVLSNNRLVHWLQFPPFFRSRQACSLMLTNKGRPNFTLILHGIDYNPNLGIILISIGLNLVNCGLKVTNEMSSLADVKKITWQ